MNYQQTVDYLYSCLPSLDKKGWSAYKPGLARVNQLLDILDNPHNSYPVIHVAGTNGKGSVSHMLASILKEAGLKVGLFTSPHLKDFRERIKVGGQEISQNEVVNFVANFSVEAKSIAPSFFEYTFALAVNYFQNEKVDIAVIETGLGGRLDCTNVVTPELSVITNISLDHEQFLGSSIEEVATEKAGIIKPGIPIVIGRRQNETRRVFEKFAFDNRSQIHYADSNGITFPCALKGDYQRENQQTVATCVEVLKALNYSITSDNVKTGLLNVVANTGLLGRWQTLSLSPKVICDVGHNTNGVKLLMDQLASDKCSKVRVVWGMSEDKKVAEIMSLLPRAYHYYWCSADNPRALDTNSIKNQAVILGLHGESYSSVNEAFDAAKKEVKEDEMIFIGGSVFVVAEVI